MKQDTPVLNCDSWLFVQVVGIVAFSHEIDHLFLTTQSETVIRR